MKNHKKSGFFNVFVFCIFLLVEQSIKSINTGIQINTDGAALTASNLISKKIDHKHSFALLAADIPDLDASKITTGTFDVLEIPNLDASKITTGTFGTIRIADSAITNAKINDVAASKITGTLATAQIADGAVTTAKIATGAITDTQVHDIAAGKITGTIASSQIANLDTSKITTGTFGTAFITDGAITNTKIHDVDGSKVTGTIDATNVGNLDASKVTSGTFGTAFISDGAITNTKIHDVDGSKITGTIASTQIPGLDASKITTGVFSSAEIPNLRISKITGNTDLALTGADLPSLDASKVTTGTFGTVFITDGAITNAKIHDVDGSKITGTIAATQVPNLDASKITTGVFSSAEIPNLRISKITGNTDLALTGADLPNLDASKIATGTFGTAFITDSSITTAKLADGAVTTAKIAAGAITDTQVHDIAAGKITGTIASSQIANLDTSKITTGTFGTAFITDGAITNTKIHDVDGSKVTGTIDATNVGNLDASKVTSGTFGTAFITDAAITNVKMHDVDGSKITGTIDASRVTIDNVVVPDGSITTEKLADGAVTDVKIHDVDGSKITGIVAAINVGNLDASKITTGTFGTAFITDDAITNVKMHDVAASKITGTLATAQIADGAITNSKISSVDASKITGVVDAARIAQLAIGNISGLETQILLIVVGGQTLLVNQTPVFIRPFTYFEPGSFLIWDNSNGPQTAEWQGILPVESTISMNGTGSLELDSDLVLKGAGNFRTLGSICSNEIVFGQAGNVERSIELSKYETLFPRCSSHQGLFNNVTLILNSDITLNAVINVGDNHFRIKGNGHTIIFNDQARIVVPAGSTLYLQDVTLKDVQSHDEVTSNGLLHSVLHGITLQDEDDQNKAYLVLENSILIPKVQKSFFESGIISLMDNNCRLGGEGKSIDIKQSHINGTGGSLLEFRVASYAGKTPITSCMDFGSVFNVIDDIDLRGSGFYNPTKIDLGGNTMIFDCCSYPSGPSLDISRTMIISEPQVPLIEDDFDTQVDGIITTQDTQLPIVGLLHKGDRILNDPSKVVFGIINPYTKAFVKGAQMKGSNGIMGDNQIIDIAFRRGQPLEITDGVNVYDRYYVAILYNGASTNSVQMCAVDIDQEFYKKDILNATQSSDYEKIGSLTTCNPVRLGRMSIKTLGEGLDGARISVDSVINFGDGYKALAIAVHPYGKELAVIVENSINFPASYELHIYQLLDSGKIVTNQEQVIKLTNGIGKINNQTKQKPLRWTVDGRFLVLSAIDGNQGLIQTFLRRDGIIEKIDDYAVSSPVALAVHPYDTIYIAIAHDATGTQQSGVEILTLNDHGKIFQNLVTFVPMINSTLFNSLEWNADGNLLVAGTEQGVKLIPYNCNHHIYQPVDNGFYNELNTNQLIKAVKFTPNGQYLLRGGLKNSLDNHSGQSILVQPLSTKDPGEIANGILDLRHDFACVVPTIITKNLTIDLNKNNLSFPATGNLTINSGVTLTLKNARIHGLRTRRHAISPSKMVNEQVGIIFKDASSTLVLDACDLDLPGDVDFITPGTIQIKTKDSTVIDGILRIPDEGFTKIASTEGFTFIADKISSSMVLIGASNNNIDQSKSVNSSVINQQIIRTETTLSVKAVQAFTQGQQQKNSFERSSDGSRTPFTIVGLENSIDSLHYPLQQYMELLGSGPGDVTISGNVQINGPTIVQTDNQSSIVDNTTIRVENGTRLIVKTGTVLTCTGQMSLVAGVNGIIIVEDGGLLQFGTQATQATDQLSLLGDGGEIELQGPEAKICFAYGNNKIVMNHRSSIDTTLGGQILINMDADLVPTTGSNLIEFALNKTKTVGSPETNIPVFIIAPNDQVAGIEKSTLLTIKNIQCTGNTNMQFMASSGKTGVAAVLNGLDQKQSVGAAQLVERLTLATLSKNNQSVNPIRIDANGQVKAASLIDPLFSYTVYNTDRAVQRWTAFTGQEVVTGTDMFGHAFRQFHGETRTNT